MNQEMAQNLIRSLMALLAVAGVLLIVKSGTAFALDPSFVGDHPALCADAARSAEDPEVSLSSRREDPADADFLLPGIPVGPLPAPTPPLRTYFARAPPAS